MSQLVLKVKINGTVTTIDGNQAGLLNDYVKVKQQAVELSEKAKVAKANLKKAEQAFYDILTDNELRLNDINDIEILDSTGTSILQEFGVKNKDLVAPKLISKAGLVSFISDGINNGFVSIDAEDALLYLQENLFTPGLSFDEVDEKLTNIQFDQLMKKTRTQKEETEKLEITEKRK